MKATAAALAIAVAIGVATTPAAEASDRHGKWADKSHGAHQSDRDHRKGAKHYRHGRKHASHRTYRYGDHKRVYRGKSGHYRKRDHYRGHRSHGYRHYRPYGDHYTRRHHGYRSGIGLNIDGVTFIWSERHYR